MVVKYGRASYTDDDLAYLGWNDKKLVKIYKFESAFRDIALILGVIWLLTTGIIMGLALCQVRFEISLAFLEAILFIGCFPGEFLFNYGLSSNETMYRWVKQGDVYSDVVIESKELNKIEDDELDYKYTLQVRKDNYKTELYTNNKELYNRVKLGETLRIYVSK